MNPDTNRLEASGVRLGYWVKGCLDCPFVRRGEPGFFGYCGVYKPPRKSPPIRGVDEMPEAPGWCPLRAAPVTVALVMPPEPEQEG
jgi:hypothetical protein